MTQKPTYAELEKRVKELEIGAVERKRIEKKLEEKEQTLQALLNAPPESSMLIGLEGKVLAINEVAAQRFGKKIDELIGTVLYDHMPYDLAESRKAQGDKVVRSGKPVYLQDERAGRIYDTNIYPVLNAEEKVTALAIHARDITETKKAEEALRESEEWYRSIIHKIQAAIVVHDADTRIIASNSKAQELLGLTEDQMLRKTATDPDWKFLNADGEIMSLKEYPVNQVLATRQPLRDLTVSIYRPNKVDRVWVLVNADPVFDHKENIQQVIVTFMDITEGRRAEEALRKSEEKYSNLFHFSNDGIFVHDLEGNILDVNQKALDQLGYTKSEMLSFKIPDFHPPEALEISQWAFETIIREGFVSFETDFKKKTGEVLPFEVSSSLYEIGDKKVIQGIIRDITERKQAEEERKKLINELQQALKEIKTLRGILPLCSFCKKIRDDKGYWEQVDVYIYKYSEADISHSICPECAKEHYPDLDI